MNIFILSFFKYCLKLNIPIDNFFKHTLGPRNIISHRLFHETILSWWWCGRHFVLPHEQNEIFDHDDHERLSRRVKGERDGSQKISTKEFYSYYMDAGGIGKRSLLQPRIRGHSPFVPKYTCSSRPSIFWCAW